MRAVSSAESIVDIEFAKRGQLPGECCFILLFSLVEAQILQQQHLAWLKRLDQSFNLRANRVGGHSHRQTQQLAEAMSHRSQAQLLDYLTIWPSQVGH